jgi:hypothetical protein
MKGRHFTDDFNDFTKSIISMNNELHQLTLDRKSKPSLKKTVFPHSSAFASLSATAAHALTMPSNGAVPMEIDAVRRGPISPSEKERRRKNYCGHGQRFVNDYPNKSAKAKAKDKKVNPSSGKA